MTDPSPASDAADRWARIERAFFLTLDHPPAERDAMLRTIEPDASIRDEVRAMLAAEHDTGAALQLEQRFVIDAAPLPALTAGTTIGPYRITALAGRGGMGEVYRAQRVDGQLDLEVALKVLRADLRSASVIERFQQERRVLARLSHPHIAAILDAGTTGDGRPWLALRFVEGVPLTAATRGRPLDERIARFLKVVDAVAFAHAHLVVHRDLKPGNILVTETGDPVLLDFGIATLLDDERNGPDDAPSSDRALTPSYAAPEQRAGGAITTATDVYALGALLFELLSDTRPPSSGSGTTASSMIAEPAMRRAVAGDLDAIINKALAVDPVTRYATASQLADDVRRWQRGEAVVARPETWGGRTRRILRRHRGIVTTATVMVLLLVGGLVREIVQSRRLAAERDRAVAERAAGEDVLSFLTELLTPSDPRVAPGGDTLRVRDVLAKAEAGAGDLAAQPERQVRLYRLLGHIRAGRGELVRAESLLTLGRQIGTDSLGPNHPEVLRTRLELMGAQRERRGPQMLMSQIVPLIEQLRATFGPTHEDVSLAYALAALIVVNADSARLLLDSSVAVRARIGIVDSVEIASQLDSRASERGRRRRWAEALAIEEAALRIVTSRFPSNHPYVLTVRGNVASYASSTGDHARAVEMSGAVLREVMRDSTARQPLGRALERYALALVQLPGMVDSATKVERQALTALRRELSPEHVLLASAMRNLAIMEAARGDAAGGLALLDSALSRVRDNPDTGAVRYMVGQRIPMLLRLGRMAEARASLLSVQGALARYAEGSDQWLQVHFWSGLVAMAAGDAAGAVVPWSVAVERAGADLPKSSRAQLRCALGVALRRAGRAAEANGMLAEDCPVLAQWGLADRSVLDWWKP
jgi:serine/threonine-protein kinase